MARRHNTLGKESPLLSYLNGESRGAVISFSQSRQICSHVSSQHGRRAITFSSRYGTSASASCSQPQQIAQNHPSLDREYNDTFLHLNMHGWDTVICYPIPFQKERQRQEKSPFFSGTLGSPNQKPTIIR